MVSPLCELHGRYRVAASLCGVLGKTRVDTRGDFGQLLSVLVWEGLARHVRRRERFALD